MKIPTAMPLQQFYEKYLENVVIIVPNILRKWYSSNEFLECHQQLGIKQVVLTFSYRGQKKEETREERTSSEAAWI